VDGAAVIFCEQELPLGEFVRVRVVQRAGLDLECSLL
jgi:hypothetical protein